MASAVSGSVPTRVAGTTGRERVGGAGRAVQRQRQGQGWKQGRDRRRAAVVCAAGQGSSGAIHREVYRPGASEDPNYVRVFDTTLRDGEQSPGCTMTSKEKLDMARQLARLGVDVIEAGFPIASPDDLEAVRSIAMDVGNMADHSPVIAGLARCNAKDIDAAWEAVRHAAKPRIHTFLATSPVHMKYKLKKEPHEVIAQAREMVAYAKSIGCNDIEFSPEDAGRSDRDFLCEVLAAVIDAGATTLNIPDTVGYTVPEEFGELIAYLKANTPGIERCVISVHCHNDLGLASANSLSAVRNGARQVECTVNGIGERAGNTSLEEVVMALYTKNIVYGLVTGIQTTQLVPASRMVSEITGMMVQPNKAIVGANAFAHESGIHQDGMLKNKETYEIISPEVIGLVRSDADVGLVLGKHSGRHALTSRLADLGYPDLSVDEVNDLFKRFKSLADKKKTILDEDLIALVSDELAQPVEIYSLNELQVVCGTMGLPTATVRMTCPDGITRVTTAVGTGPVDAAYKAIDQLTGLTVELLEYGITSVTSGIDAQAKTNVRLRPILDTPQSSTHAQSGLGVLRTYTGSSAAEDIVVSSARAYMAAVNKVLATLSAQGQLGAVTNGRSVPQAEQAAI